MNKDFWLNKILLVDDDTSILNMLEVILKKENFKNIYKASSGFEAIRISKDIEPDIIVLDIMLPDIDGYEVCRKIRDFSMVPILFLSAKGEETDKLISFAMGGDDYITKPFSPKELIARIYAILKRISYYEKIKNKKNNYIFGEYKLDFEKKELYKNSCLVDLTLKEYLLLCFIIQNAGITVSKEQIVESVWGEEYDGFDNTVMVHIRHLREKIEKEPSKPQYIKTIKGRGYRFENNNIME